MRPIRLICLIGLIEQIRPIEFTFFEILYKTFYLCYNTYVS